MFLNSAWQKAGAEGRGTKRGATVKFSGKDTMRLSILLRAKGAAAQTGQTCIAEVIARPLVYTFL